MGIAIGLVHIPLGSVEGSDCWELIAEEAGLMSTFSVLFSSTVCMCHKAIGKLAYIYVVVALRTLIDRSEE